MRLFLAILAASSLLALLACGQPDAPHTPAATAAITSDGGPCNAVIQQGEFVDLVGSTGAAPKPSGGTIEDGTYVLIGLTLYSPSSKENGVKLAALGKTTMEVHGTTTQLVRTNRDGTEQHTTVTRVNSGIDTTATTTCVSPAVRPDDPTTAQFSATGTSLLFINNGPAGTSVATYRKLAPAAPTAQ